MKKKKKKCFHSLKALSALSLVEKPLRKLNKKLNIFYDSVKMDPLGGIYKTNTRRNGRKKNKEKLDMKIPGLSAVSRVRRMWNRSGQGGPLLFRLPEKAFHARTISKPGDRPLSIHQLSLTRPLPLSYGDSSPPALVSLTTAKLPSLPLAFTWHRATIHLIHASDSIEELRAINTAHPRNVPPFLFHPSFFDFFFFFIVEWINIKKIDAWKILKLGWKRVWILAGMRDKCIIYITLSCKSGKCEKKNKNVGNMFFKTVEEEICACKTLLLFFWGGEGGKVEIRTAKGIRWRAAESDKKEWKFTVDKW